MQRLKPLIIVFVLLVQQISFASAPASASGRSKAKAEANQQKESKAHFSSLYREGESHHDHEEGAGARAGEVEGEGAGAGAGAGAGVVPRVPSSLDFTGFSVNDHAPAPAPALASKRSHRFAGRHDVGRRPVAEDLVGNHTASDEIQIIREHFAQIEQRDEPELKVLDSLARYLLIRGMVCLSVGIHVTPGGRYHLIIGFNQASIPHDEIADRLLEKLSCITRTECSRVRDDRSSGYEATYTCQSSNDSTFALTLLDGSNRYRGGTVHAELLVVSKLRSLLAIESRRKVDSRSFECALGVSLLCCAPCYRYLEEYYPRVQVRGTHALSFPGWCNPSSGKFCHKRTPGFVFEFMQAWAPQFRSGQCSAFASPGKGKIGYHATLRSDLARLQSCCSPRGSEFQETLVCQMLQNFSLSKSHACADTRKADRPSSASGDGSESDSDDDDDYFVNWCHQTAGSRR